MRPDAEMSLYARSRQAQRRHNSTGEVGAGQGLVSNVEFKVQGFYMLFLACITDEDSRVGRKTSSTLTFTSAHVTPTALHHLGDSVFRTKPLKIINSSGFMV